MNTNSILIIGFAYAALVSLAMGFYVIKIKRRSLTYVTFFVSTLALSLWAMSSMMVQYSSVLEVAFFWRRLSALGTGLFYLFVLHFVMHLVSAKKSKLLVAGIIITYLPAAVLLYGYFISTPIVRNQIQMVKTGYGWTTLAINNGWEYGFYAFYLFYIFTAIILLALWYRRCTEKNDRKTARNILLAFMVTFISGSMIDVIANATAMGMMPQLGPVLSLLPIAVIFLSMMNYGFLLIQKEPLKVEILDDRTRKKIDLNIIAITFFASIISLIAYLVLAENKQQFLALSLILMMISGIVLFISRSLKLQRYRDLILAVVIFCAIPCVSMPIYMNGITDIWALSILPVILLLLFTNKKAFTLTAASIILTQILICLFEYRINDGIFDLRLMLRFVIVFLALKFVSYINTVYVERLKENTYIAYHDANTTLPNRRYFNDVLDNQIRNSEKTGQKFYVLVMDIDHFKLVNDMYGHAGGDRILKAIAKKLQEVIAENEFCAYFGGNTFLLISQVAINQNLDVFIDEMINNINKSSQLIKSELKITMSIGVAEYLENGEDSHSLIRNADLAMYKAKEMGGDGTVFCTKEMLAELDKIQMITNRLFGAIERQEIYLNYQPKVNCKNEKIEAVEALVRWNDRELGFISPGIFIEIAEKNGLIDQIGEWVFNEACRQVKQWAESGRKAIPIAVNVSGQQLMNPQCIEKMKNAIARNRIDPSFIEVEVTESVAMNESVDIKELLQQLKAIGISIAIDDFGTGYSSLCRLSELSADVLKIDKSFVDGISKTKKDQSVIKVISI